MSATDLGTLMWIGPRSGEFDDPYQYCLAHAAQLAMRVDCDQALQRRAAGVRGIVVARNHRAPISAHSLTRLQRRYSAAEVVHVTGALCDGMRSSEDLPFHNRVPWHCWKEVLPGWLQRWGDAQPESIQHSRSVAVVASHFQAAEPLLDLATSTGATTVWVQSTECSRAKNFDAVWWDDSIATATTPEQWQCRLEQFAAGVSGAQHCWIVGQARPEDFQSAQIAGIARIITKPYRIDRLLETLAKPVADTVRVAA